MYRTTKSPFAAVVLLAMATSAHSLDVNPGDAIDPPVGSTLIAGYYVYNKMDSPRVDGRVSDGPGLRADVGLLRVGHAFALGTIQVTPQIGVPFGRTAGTGTLASAPRNSGVGDITLLASIQFLRNVEARTAAYVMPAITLPTGAYGRDGLSIGENRYKYTLQFGAQTPISEKWTLDGFADVNRPGFRGGSTL